MSRISLGSTSAAHRVFPPGSSNAAFGKKIVGGAAHGRADHFVPIAAGRRLAAAVFLQVTAGWCQRSAHRSTGPHTTQWASPAQKRAVKTTAPPWEKPARMMRAGSMPLSRCASIRRISCRVEPSSCSRLIARAGAHGQNVVPAGHGIPRIDGDRPVGAWSTKRVLGSTSCKASSTGRKS